MKKKWMKNKRCEFFFFSFFKKYNFLQQDEVAKMLKKPKPQLALKFLQHIMVSNQNVLQCLRVVK